MRAAVSACATDCARSFREGNDQRADGQGERGDREPEGRGVGAVAVGGGVALGLVVWLDVDHVVLLHVIHGRLGQLIHVGEVYLVDGLLTVGAFAHYGDVLTHAVGGDVTGHGDGFDDGEVVLVKLYAAGAIDFAQHRDACVGEVDGDDGILDEFAALDFGLDVSGELCAVHIGDVESAQYGEVDVAVSVDGVKRGIAAAAAGGRSKRTSGTSGTDTVLGGDQIEHGGEGRVLCGDYDGELVFGAHLDVVAIQRLDSLAGSDVLEICYVLGCGAR